MSMSSKSLYLVITMLCSVLTVGCDKVCPTTVENIATVQNTTGRALSLSVCRNTTVGYALTPTKVEALLNLTNDGHENDVSLGTEQSSKAVGGPTASCSSVSDSKQDVRFRLTSTAFSQAKLCIDASNVHVIVERFQACPAGSMEQMAPEDCTN